MNGWQNLTGYAALSSRTIHAVDLPPRMKMDILDQECDILEGNSTLALESYFLYCKLFEPRLDSES